MNEEGALESDREILVLYHLADDRAFGCTVKELGLEHKDVNSNLHRKWLRRGDGEWWAAEQQTYSLREC